MSQPSSAQMAQLQALLQDRKQVLMDELKRDARALRDDSARTRDPGTDAGDLSESDHAAAVSAGEMARDADELQAVEQALERMSNSAYGLCVNCGEGIPVARLLASPIASRCVRCQAQFERAHPGTARHSL